jgi:hypothetical protein
LIEPGPRAAGNDSERGSCLRSDAKVACRTYSRFSILLNRGLIDPRLLAHRCILHRPLVPVPYSDFDKTRRSPVRGRSIQSLVTSDEPRPPLHDWSAQFKVFGMAVSYFAFAGVRGRMRQAHFRVVAINAVVAAPCTE